MEDKITITIKKKNWKELSKLKINIDEIKSHDDAIEFLLDKYKEDKK